MDFNQRMNNLRSNLNKNKAGIMTGIGIGGFLYSSYLFCKQTVRATRKVDAKKRELGVDELTFKEKFMLCWKDYIFPTSVTAASIALIVKSDNIQTRETGELLSAVMVSRSVLNDYKEAVQETVSEKKKEEIEEKANKKYVDEILSDPTTRVYPTGNGEVLFIENLTGTVFRSKKENVLIGIASINDMISDEGYASVNDLRYEWDLPGHALGEILGFNASTGKIEYTLEAHSYMGELCWNIIIHTKPMEEYDLIYPRKN